MKAIVYTAYGSPDALRLREMETPTPGDNELLVSVQATGINAADRLALSGKPYIVRLFLGAPLRPKHAILGSDVAGQVEAIGRAVTKFRPGDAVYGDLSGCGLGGFAEYVCAPEQVWAMKPANLSFAEAAAVPMPAVTALQALRDKGQIQAGQQVLIHGASGGVGTFAVQIAKAFGAEVTAVCSARNADLARSLGADRVIDYAREDFLSDGRRYDLILTVNGYRPIGDYRRALAPDGVYVAAGGTMPQMFQAMLMGPLLSGRGGKRVSSVSAQPNAKDLAYVGELLSSGKVRPMVERSYPLDETAEAFRHLEREHARGKVVVAPTG